MLKTVKKDENDNSATDFDSFKTSTPNKKTVQCEECINRTQCTDCFVRQDMMTRNSHMMAKTNDTEYTSQKGHSWLLLD